MEFNIDRADLLAAIDKCSLVIDLKHPTESFRLMTVETKKKTVRLAASGEFASLATVAEAEVKNQGGFIVSPSRLRDIAAVMPLGRIQVSLKGERVTVKSLVSSRKATFQRHSAELRAVEDPGSKAPWKQVNARELTRALRMVKHASTWDVRDDPTVSLLIPTERGLDVFGCNSYLVSLVETSIRIDGDNIQVPESAAAALALMVETDDNVRIFCDGMRTYLESCDTIVSALLTATDSAHSYKFYGEMLAFILNNLRNGANTVGPVISLSKLHQGFKSVMSLAGFARDNEKGSRGLQVHAVIGSDTVVLDLGLSEADARDEFDVIQSGAELEFWLSSQFLDKFLGSLSGVEEVQALRAENIFVLRSQGVVTGIMEEVKK